MRSPRRGYSSGIGSLTPRIMSDSAQMSSGSSMILAPVATKSASGMDEPSPAPSLDVDRVAGRGELAHAGRGDGHPVLVVLDLLGHPDDHQNGLSCIARRRTWLRSLLSKGLDRQGRVPRIFDGNTPTNAANPAHPC